MRKQELVILISVIILAAIIFVIFLTTAFFSPHQPTESPQPSSIPLMSIRPTSFPGFSPLPQASFLPSSAAPETTPKEQIINSLPYKSIQFNVEYYYDGDIFRITIKENPYLENKAKAEEWFRQSGVNPSNLNIFWDAYPEVER